jgi:hypothetical protein
VSGSWPLPEIRYVHVAEEADPGDAIMADDIVRELRSIGLLSGGDAVEAALGPSRPVELTAPVVLPAREEMSVYLVSRHSIQRLDELRSDLHLYSTAVSLLVGALLGVLTALLTGKFPHGNQLRNTIILATVFVIILMFCLIRLRTVSKRVTAVRARMYSDVDLPDPPQAEQPHGS